MPDSPTAVQAHEGLHNPALLHHFATEEQQRDASNLGMWIFLGTEVMFFGGLFCAYLIYRGWYFGDFAAASKSIDAALGATNTAVLICSSLTVVLAIWAAQTARRGLLIAMLILTMLFGLGFLGHQRHGVQREVRRASRSGHKFQLRASKKSPAIPVNTPTRAMPRFSLPFTSS